MKFTCSICNHEFEAEWDNLKDGEWACPGCHRISPSLIFTGTLIMNKAHHGVVYDINTN